MSEFAESLQVDYLAVDRSVVDLKVTRVHDESRGCAKCNGVGVRDGVIYPYELSLECVAKLHPVAVSAGIKRDALKRNVVVLKLMSYKFHRKLSAVDGALELS